MLKFGITLTLFSLLMGAAFAQTPPAPAPASTPSVLDLPQFSITATAMSLSGQGQTSPAADVGAELQITDNWFFRSDNIMVPAIANTTNVAGANWLVSNKWLAKTKLPSDKLQPYLTGSMGISRTGVAPTNKFAAMFGGGMKYCGGSTCATIAEIRWAHIPGLNNSTVIVSSGLSFGWHW
jgi:hypothetical protein